MACKAIKHRFESDSLLQNICPSERARSDPLRNLHTVGERFKCSEAYDASRSGALGGENARMSNRKWGENPHRRKPKVSSAMSITGGLGAPKDNRAYGHGRPMDSRLIFRPLCDNLRSDRGHKLERIIGFLVLGF